jgi:hypothetical protein
MNKFVFTKIILTFCLCCLFFLISCGNKESVEKKTSVSVQNRLQNGKQQQTIKNKFKQSDLLSEMSIVNLYFISKNSSKLTIERREVLKLPDKQQMLKQVLSTLAYGPLTDLYPSIPENFSIIETFIVGKTVYVDLKKSDKGEAGIESVESETLFLYSIVNTALSTDGELDSVKILINGEEAETLLGHISSSGFFRFNDDIVEKY